jgi:DNA-binding PadR family transcriptional regulator
MPTINIPSKICPHCNGIKWYINPKNEQEICYQKLIESNKIYHKTERGKAALERARAKERNNITDNYLRQLIYSSIYNETEDKIVRQSIPKEHLEKYRENLKFQRQNKKTKHEKKSIKQRKVKTNC